MTRSGLSLAQATRVLGALGHADPAARGAIVRSTAPAVVARTRGPRYPRFNLVDLRPSLRASAWGAARPSTSGCSDGGAFPTAPYWHRDCPDCPYAKHCEARARESRRRLAGALYVPRSTARCCANTASTRAPSSPVSIPRSPTGARHTHHHRSSNRTEPKRSSGRTDRQARRPHLPGSRSRTRERRCASLAAERHGVPHRRRRSRRRHGELRRRHVSVGRLRDAERADRRCPRGLPRLRRVGRAHAEMPRRGYFREFWSWLKRASTSSVEPRDAVSPPTASGRAAEDGAMNRAVAIPALDGGRRSTTSRVSSGRTAGVDRPARTREATDPDRGTPRSQTARRRGWLSLARRQPQWRSVDALVRSGDARRLARRALASRERIVDYNEDDCRATKALRDWLNGPARSHSRTATTPCKFSAPIISIAQWPSLVRASTRGLSPSSRPSSWGSSASVAALALAVRSRPRR